MVLSRQPDMVETARTLPGGPCRQQGDHLESLHVGLPRGGAGPGWRGARSKPNPKPKEAVEEVETTGMHLREGQ